MTDLEITKLCAEAMGLKLWRDSTEFNEANWKHDQNLWVDSGSPGNHWLYCPLRNDAQAMALLKKYIDTYDALVNPIGYRVGAPGGGFVKDKDLNRAIVTCVAKLQLAKQKVAA